jgi:hypothetical protein
MNNAKQMTSAGINPNSGLFKRELTKLDEKKKQAKSDMMNQAQVSQQNRYTGGLQNIVAMGQGQEAQTTSGLGDLASMANQRSRNDRSIDARERYGNQQAAGGLVGAGVRYGMSD